MTQEAKVALLKEAGVWDVIGFPTCIDKLFNLIAAHEREACAKVCEPVEGSAYEVGVYKTMQTLAAAIRARSEQ